MTKNKDCIEVFGAREHNLKDIDAKIPHNKIVVFTGPSGSGKSSLAFDTIYAEGQRRYIETFSAYARQFLGGLERPDVDKIDGLPPVIAIEQKTVSKNPRSTVGTITEIYDFLRLLYAKTATARSMESGEEMVNYSDEQIKDTIVSRYKDKKIIILSPLVRSRKGHYKELFSNISKRGFLEARIDGEITEITAGLKLDRFKIHDIEVVVDKFKLNGRAASKRLPDAINIALHHGNNALTVLDYETGESIFLSKDLVCPTSGISYASPEPNSFSFNSPKGACNTCGGLGTKREFEFNLLFQNKKMSFLDAIEEKIGKLKNKNWLLKQINIILEKNNHDPKVTVDKVSKEALNETLYGVKELVNIKLKFADIKKTYRINFSGLIPFLETLAKDKSNSKSDRLLKSISTEIKCPKCNGYRLKQESLHFFIDNKNIGEASNMSLLKLQEWLEQINNSFSERQKIIAVEILKEIKSRLQFLMDVGLNYLTIGRSAKTLSGGEAQRIRLATQIGTELVNVLYILDEPSIGLHSRDNERLIKSLKKLRDIGNSVIVVEHDKEMMLASDLLYDIGPKAGENGGNIVWSGPSSEIKNADTITGNYISGLKKVAVPKKRRKGNGDFIFLKNASGNNLKNVDLKIPLGTLVCVSGVSGSGKSTLINETLYPILNQYFYRSVKEPLPYAEIKGLEFVDKVIEINQSPIGKTPRSNPATYTAVFGVIRNLFAQLPEAKIRGYAPGRFSFNVSGGRCPTCEGAGLKLIEMNFLPDIYIPCETCNGLRFNRETLEVRYKGKSIADVLNMTINDGVEFFSAIPNIHRCLSMLKEVGLGYISLGQQSTTLSGGEAQRVKLASELSKKQTGKTVYILDEPTTGLHFEDINILMKVINTLVEKGNTVIIIEHNLDVLKQADFLVEIGPEGGEQGGEIMAQGTPEQVAKSDCHSARFLKLELEA